MSEEHLPAIGAEEAAHDTSEEYPPDYFDDNDSMEQHPLIASTTGGDEQTPSQLDLSGAETNPLTGLTQQQAEQRLRKFGKNQLPEEKSNNFKKFLAYFTSPIELVIEAAGILALALQDWV